ncbi:hypothetical protein KXD93_07505 [Mucilaginibacter sp. BJC16-A38]|uniref:DUF5990 family protein n=1 Tax=Mucilaginibacter phenanthrenivorans TaxID=1234842 RepID=UPI00215710AE|nr:DUF5990 family protein [Mucilaginibacter phenanthrenivorans]MCR8557481.1 hypothetical protein [Mucilaginibacter phenanthrenivorans]
MTVNLHIILQKPPAGIHFALQKGHGNVVEAVQVQISADGDLHFELMIDVKVDPAKTELARFGGPYVQGPPVEKFIYIGIGTFAGQVSPWSRRLKIPLRDISWDLINRANENSGLETIVPGTAKDGSPTCATVKPFAGWHLRI